MRKRIQEPVRVRVKNHPVFGTKQVRRYHLVYWENTGKTVPEGYVIHHKDHNNRNDEFSNLQLMTANEHNSYHRKVGNPWNKGKKGLQKRPDQTKRNQQRIWNESSRNKISNFAKNRTDLIHDSRGRFILKENENES